MKTEKKERKKGVICVILGICIGAVLTGVMVQRRTREVNGKITEVQESLAGEVFRFHVLADSDSDEAQEVKLKVRDKVLDYMKRSMSGSEEIVSSEQTKQWASEHLLEIERLAEETIREEGYFYGADAEVTTCYFPEKQYGDITFPQGYYEALRIRLGRAKGHNWWCVLYPNLCFLDTTCAVVSEEGKEDLQSALTAEEYQLITATTEFKIKSFFFGDGGEP